MNYITPVNNYFVLMPSGDIRGFKEVDEARGTIYEHYFNKALSCVHSGGESYYDIYGNYNDVGIISGVEEGECQIYDLEGFMDKIRTSDMFQEEIDELISKLLVDNIKMNVYEYGIYDLLSDVDVEWA